ncbi:unnamed protein product [Ceratitis capitata]|uniref:(Mediterranean fruit fly) hypothetical protein n=1 Tax=Ceratitis capitata TaxID=7213 RepID=A0A811UQU7_CERCA|nr:unnamed protein product [Ceratitis capitata]
MFYDLTRNDKELLKLNLLQATVLEEGFCIIAKGKEPFDVVHFDSVDNSHAKKHLFLSIRARKTSDYVPQKL